MSLNAVVRMTRDDGLLNRVAAACAVVGGGQNQNYVSWAAQSMWKLASDAGWRVAYQRGLDEENYQGDPAAYTPTVGKSDDYITDEMIISAVTDLRAAEFEEALKLKLETESRVQDSTPPPTQFGED